MKKYPLDKLRQVRELRMNMARAKMIEKKQLMKIAKSHYHMKKKEHADYRRWRKNKEEALYANINNEPVTAYVLDNFYKEINYLRSVQHEMQNEVLEAQKDVEMALLDVEQATKAYQHIEKKKITLDEHHSDWCENVNRLAQQAEDRGSDE